MTDTEFDWASISPDDVQDAEPIGGAFQFLTSDEESSPFIDQSEPEPSGLEEDKFTQPDDKTIAYTRPRGAVTYQRKVRSILRTVFDMTVQNPATVADSAAVLLYAESISEKAGDLAATDPKAARVIDFLSGDVTENHYLALGLAATPLILQVIRNHEPVLEPIPRGFTIPFVKDKAGNPRRFRIRMGIKLGRLRPITKDPKHITDYVYSNPLIKKQLEKRGIKVAEFPNRRRRSQSDDN